MIKSQLLLLFRIQHFKVLAHLSGGKADEISIREPDRDVGLGRRLVHKFADPPRFLRVVQVSARGLAPLLVFLPALQWFERGPAVIIARPLLGPADRGVWMKAQNGDKL